MSITRQPDPVSLVAGPELPPRPYRCQRCRVVGTYPYTLSTGGAACTYCGGSIHLDDVIEFASFGVRLLAVLLDVMLVGVITGASLMFVGWIAGPLAPTDAQGNVASEAKFWFAVLFIAIALTFSAAYLLIGNGIGKTIGKRATGLVVADAVTGYPPGLGGSLARTEAQFLMMLTLGVGYAMAFRHPRRQALHDRIANTIVIET